MRQRKTLNVSRNNINYEWISMVLVLRNSLWMLSWTIFGLAWAGLVRLQQTPQILHSFSGAEKNRIWGIYETASPANTHKLSTVPGAEDGIPQGSYEACKTSQAQHLQKHQAAQVQRIASKKEEPDRLKRARRFEGNRCGWNLVEYLNNNVTSHILTFAILVCTCYAFSTIPYPMQT